MSDSTVANAVVATLQKPAAKTATFTSASVDLRDYDGVGSILLACAAATAGTNPTLDVKVQDSADNSSFADVAGLTFTQVTNADSLQKLNIDTGNLRRYIQVVGTIGGTSTPTFTPSVVFLGRKKYV